MATKKGAAPPDPAQVAEALSNSMLKEMINELEETKLKLLLNIKELKEKLVQQKDDQADIYYYLNKKCDESFEVIASLEEQIINEQTDREIAEKMYENRIEEMKASQQVMEGKYTSKISELETRLEMLNSFNEEKEESEKTLKQLMAKLEEERNQFRTNTESIENRFLLERDKLRKTYDQKYEKIKKELEASVEGKMSNKTKKTQIMNVVMKKELDSQSKHAEKLLEINQSMLERDKALKLELDVVNSLHSDMTLRLAMSQRTIKQLNEKVAALEAAEATARQQHEARLHEKAEAIIQLEARLGSMSKKSRSENSKMDDMWGFLAQSFALLRGPAGAEKDAPGTRKKGKGAPGTPSAALGGAWTGNIVEHEKVLVSLVKEVVRKFPQLLPEGPRDEPSVRTIQTGQFTSSAATAEPAVTSSASYWAQSSSLSADPAEAQRSSSLLFSSTTGIPAWDLKKTTEGDKPRGRSIGVQTEGKVAPYPDGSLWMEAPGARSLHFQQQSAALAAAQLDGDNSSVGFNSVQSLWRSMDNSVAGEADVGSLLSNSGEYSAKTASHVLHAPARTKTKPSKVISKMRRQNMRNASAALEDYNNAQQQMQQLELASSSYMSIAGETMTGGAPRQPQTKMPVSLQLGSAYQGAPSPLSLGSAGYLPHGLGMGMGMGMPIRSSLQMSGNHKAQPFSPLISVSGQGFVAPLVLPKL